MIYLKRTERSARRNFLNEPLGGSNSKTTHKLTRYFLKAKKTQLLRILLKLIAIQGRNIHGRRVHKTSDGYVLIGKTRQIKKAPGNRQKSASSYRIESNTLCRLNSSNTLNVRHGNTTSLTPESRSISSVLK